MYHNIRYSEKSCIILLYNLVSWAFPLQENLSLTGIKRLPGNQRRKANFEIDKPGVLHRGSQRGGLIKSRYCRDRSDRKVCDYLQYSEYGLGAIMPLYQLRLDDTLGSHIQSLLLQRPAAARVLLTKTWTRHNRPDYGKTRYSSITTRVCT